MLNNKTITMIIKIKITLLSRLINRTKVIPTFKKNNSDDVKVQKNKVIEENKEVKDKLVPEAKNDKEKSDQENN